MGWGDQDESEDERGRDAPRSKAERDGARYEFFNFLQLGPDLFPD